MHPESRTNRTFFQHRLAKLKAAVPGIELAAIASEDGLLAATDADLEPDPVDRRAAVIASLAAVAQAAARELGHGEVRSLRIGDGAGALLLRPFGRPRRRLLLLLLGPQADMGKAALAAQLLAGDIELRLAPLADHHAADAASGEHIAAAAQADASKLANAEALAEAHADAHVEAHADVPQGAGVQAAVG